MTIHVLTAVHNRRETTQQFLSDLFRQSLSEPLHIVVVDDGSTDGTGAMLHDHVRTAPAGVELSIESGDGSWWWAKSMAAAVDCIRPRLTPNDVVVFMNDDISVPSDVLAHLAGVSRSNECIVQATCRDVNDHTRILDRGARLDPKTLAVLPLPLISDSRELIAVDVAPGRTVAYPADIFEHELNIDHVRLPHHLADLEFSVRARRLGFPIRLSEEVSILSRDDFSVSRSNGSIIKRLTHVSSSVRLASYWAFWRTVLPDLPRPVLALRFLRYLLIPNLLTSVPGFAALSQHRIEQQAPE